MQGRVDLPALGQIGGCGLVRLTAIDLADYRETGIAASSPSVR